MREGFAEGFEEGSPYFERCRDGRCRDGPMNGARTPAAVRSRSGARRELPAVLPAPREAALRDLPPGQGSGTVRANLARGAARAEEGPDRSVAERVARGPAAVGGVPRSALLDEVSEQIEVEPAVLVLWASRGRGRRTRAWHGGEPGRHWKRAPGHGGPQRPETVGRDLVGACATPQPQPGAAGFPSSRRMREMGRRR